MFQRQADNQQLWVCVTSCITRDREPQLAAGGRLNGVSAARQHLGIAARRNDRASFERSALEHGEVSSWSCCRVATQPCWRRFYFVSRSLLEKKRNRYYLVLVSRETGFPGEFVEGQGKSSLKGEGLDSCGRGEHASRWPRRPFGAHLTTINYHCLLLYHWLCIS